MISTRHACLLIALSACADDAAIPGCDEPSTLARIEDGLAAADTCRTWLDDVRGRVLVSGANGSAVAWSRRTDDGYALVASAVHTLGDGWFGTSGSDVARALVAPETRGVLRLRVPAPDTAAPQLDSLSSLYSLFHVAIPAGENRDGLRGILPRHDVFLGLTDRSRISDNGGVFPMELERTPGLVALHDPDDHTRLDPILASPASGDLVLLVGYPQDTSQYPRGAYAVGRVLGDAAAVEAISALAVAGDEEGTIPYDAEAEMLVVGDAAPGMSGGGAFLADGTWVGTLVRGSDPQANLGGRRIVRIVRASYLAAQTTAAFRALDETQRLAFAPFLDSVLE
jgi:hypothetical protein